MVKAFQHKTIEKKYAKVTYRYIISSKTERMLMMSMDVTFIYAKGRL